MVAYVRIHPHDPRKGHTVKRYNYRGFTFREDRGWYRVTDALSKELEPLLVNKHTGIEVNVFQIGTEEQALAIAKADYEEQNPQRAIESAVTGAQTVSSRKLEKLPEPEEDLDEDAELLEDDAAGGSDDEDGENPFE